MLSFVNMYEWGDWTISFRWKRIIWRFMCSLAHDTLNENVYHICRKSHAICNVIIVTTIIEINLWSLFLLVQCPRLLHSHARPLPICLFDSWIRQAKPVKRNLSIKLSSPTYARNRITCMEMIAQVSHLEFKFVYRFSVTFSLLMSLPSKNEVIRLILMLERKVANILLSHLPHERRWRRMRGAHINGDGNDTKMYGMKSSENDWSYELSFQWWRMKPHCFSKLHQSPEGGNENWNISESEFLHGIFVFFSSAFPEILL